MKKCCKTNKKYNFTEVENKFLEKDYILISSVEEYNDCSSSLLYICSKHKEKGIQKTTFGHILEGKGCMYCGRINTGLSEQISSTQAMQLCEEKKLYYQGKYIKNKNTNIKFICPKHLLAGLQYMKYSNMKRENIIGCKYCGAQFKNLRCSFGERKIKAVLDKVGVKYIREYKFENCRDILPLPFDFYLPHYNICIEYDGEQHFLSCSV